VVAQSPEVQQALLLVWNAANRICTKRLIPFLPTLLDALEHHGHLHLTEEIRNQLLSMSTATADRILQAKRHTSVRRGEIAHSPVKKVTIPHVQSSLSHLIQLDAFEQFVLASQRQSKSN
jgi:hypothetical protein